MHCTSINTLEGIIISDSLLRSVYSLDLLMGGLDHRASSQAHFSGIESASTDGLSLPLSPSVPSIHRTTVKILNYISYHAINFPLGFQWFLSQSKMADQALYDTALSATHATVSFSSLLWLPTSRLSVQILWSCWCYLLEQSPPSSQESLPHFIQTCPQMLPH